MFWIQINILLQLGNGKEGNYSKTNICSIARFLFIHFVRRLMLWRLYYLQRLSWAVTWGALCVVSLIVWLSHLIISTLSILQIWDQIREITQNILHRKFQKKYVLLNAENTQESFLSDMIRNRFPESSLILSISSHSPLLRFNKSFLCSSILLVRMTLGTGRTQNLFSSFIPTE